MSSYNTTSNQILEYFGFQESCTADVDTHPSLRFGMTTCLAITSIALIIIAALGLTGNFPSNAFIPTVIGLGFTGLVFSLARGKFDQTTRFVPLLLILSVAVVGLLALQGGISCNVLAKTALIASGTVALSIVMLHVHRSLPRYGQPAHFSPKEW